jgi:hypothetical protein
MLLPGLALGKPTLVGSLPCALAGKGNQGPHYRGHGRESGSTPITPV